MTRRKIKGDKKLTQVIYATELLNWPMMRRSSPKRCRAAIIYVDNTEVSCLFLLTISALVCCSRYDYFGSTGFILSEWKGYRNLIFLDFEIGLMRYCFSVICVYLLLYVYLLK